MEFDKVNIEKTSPEMMRVLSRFFDYCKEQKGKNRKMHPTVFDIGRNS